MRKLLVLPLMAMLGLGACTDPYGRVDPLATGLLGAGLGAAAGVGIAAASQPSYGYGYGGGYYRPAPTYYRPAPYYARPAPYYGRPYYGGGWGRRGW
jgi:hypothetical protein